MTAEISVEEWIAALRGGSTDDFVSSVRRVRDAAPKPSNPATAAPELAVVPPLDLSPEAEQALYQLVVEAGERR